MIKYTDCELTQWVKCLVCKHGFLCSEVMEKPGIVACIFTPVLGTERQVDLRSSQSSQYDDFQVKQEISSQKTIHESVRERHAEAILWLPHAYT